MEVSIIIPTFSPGSYIYECLDSIIGQTLPANEFETIIILNGIRDPYYNELKEYISVHSTHCFQLFYADEPGVSNARNIGLDNAKGEYITFVDDDDILSPAYLAGLLAVSSPTCVGVSNGLAFVNNVEDRREYAISKLHKKLREESFTLLKYRQYLSPPVYKLLHRSIIESTRFDVSMKISEDSLFCFKLSKNIKEMKCAPESSIYYVRMREGSATRKKMKTSYVLGLTIKKMWLFTEIYFSNPFKYSFLFYMSRLMACIKHMWWLLAYARK